MGSQVVNLFVIMAIGVILAMLVGNAKGTGTILTGVESLWATGVNGMLGQSSTVPSPSGSGGHGGNTQSYTPPSPSSQDTRSFYVSA